MRGSYLEACNCHAICPCRRSGGRPGAPAEFGECAFALSWRIESGADGDVDLAGLGVVLAGRYHEDEPGSPWRYVLYVDERGIEPQREALEAIFTGARGGTPWLNFPWVFKPSELVAVHPASLEIEHTRTAGRFRVGRDVVVRVARDADQPEAVSCLIPGHDHPGTEVVTELMRIEGEAGSWELRGRCGFQTAFAYSGPD